MRMMVAIALISTLGGCAGSAGGPSIDGGVASYDALRSARAACVAKGGELVRSPGGSGQRMTDYACKRK